MLPNTSRARRGQILATIGRDRFENDEDYYFFQHLNDRVQLAHSVSFVVAVTLFVLSIVKLSWVLFLIQYVISTGVAVGAHWVFDDYIPSGPAKTPLRVLFFGIRKNLLFLVGKTRAHEARFLLKYPFAAEPYRN